MTKEIAVIEKGASVDFASVADKLLDMTKGLVEAATPVAKQAYETGLLTLRIDALQSVLIAILFFIIFTYLSYKIPSSWRKAKEEAKENQNRRYGDNQNIAWCIFLSNVMFTLASGIVSFPKLLSVWMWVQLFRPELWLVHQAIEKLIK